ncbi:hypothetical protein FACS189431_7170 [Alphaproteobacteria bacterium]|nr:hypothetical protein FACS189431_7170 [Alphaproteobacteria bacterium]
MNIPIVDENDNVIGEISRETLRGENVFYRVAGLWVVSPDRESVLIARRALSKKHHPGKWGPSAIELSCKVVLVNQDGSKVLLNRYENGHYGLLGGHMEGKEEFAETIRRELKEEIGVDYDGELRKVDFSQWLHENKGMMKVELHFAGRLDDSTQFVLDNPDTEEGEVSPEWVAVKDIKQNLTKYNGLGYGDVALKAVEEMK